MDKKTAFKILGISPTVSLEKAKKVYRDLARKYHPDLAGRNLCPADDERMKFINIAFRTIAPGLKSVEQENDSNIGRLKKNEREKHPGDRSFLRKIFNRIKARPKTAGGFKSGSGPDQSGAPGRGTHFNFDEILRSCTSETKIKNQYGSNNKARRLRFRNTNTRQYRDYMKIQRKYKTVGRQRKAHRTIEAVEPVEPVSSVKPVANE